jgi:hypothetical protein
MVGVFLKEVPLRKTYAIPAEGVLDLDVSDEQVPREVLLPAPAPALAADPPPSGDDPPGDGPGEPLPDPGRPVGG